MQNFHHVLSFYTRKMSAHFFHHFTAQTFSQPKIFDFDWLAWKGGVCVFFPRKAVTFSFSIRGENLRKVFPPENTHKLVQATNNVVFILYALQERLSFAAWGKVSSIRTRPDARRENFRSSYVYLIFPRTDELWTGGSWVFFLRKKLILKVGHILGTNIMKVTNGGEIFHLKTCRGNPNEFSFPAETCDCVRFTSKCIIYHHHHPLGNHFWGWWHPPSACVCSSTGSQLCCTNFARKCNETVTGRGRVCTGAGNLFAGRK